MEVIENSNLNTLFSAQKFKAVGAGAGQSSFVAELDLSVNVAAEVCETSEKPVDVKTNDKPQIKEEKKFKSEDEKTQKASDAKEEPKKDVAKIEDSKNVVTDADSNNVIAENVIEAKNQETVGSENVNQMVEQVAGAENSGIKAGDLENEGGQNDIEATQEGVSKATKNKTAVSEVESAQNVEVSSQVVSLAQTQTQTQATAMTDVVVEDALSDVDALGVEAKDVSSASLGVVAEVAEMPEVQQILKSSEIKAQEQAIAEKIANPNAKLEIAVEVEQVGFDFSQPKIVVSENAEAKELVSGTEASEIADVNALFNKTQMTVPETLNAGVASVQNPNLQGAEVANKVVQNNVAPIGLEVGNKTSKFNEVANTQKLANNDNLKAMSKEVIEQIKVNITKSAIKGVDVIDIKLKPEDLGELSIRIELKKEDGSVEINIAATNKETLELLQKDAANLQKAFEDAGYKMGENSLNFSEQGQQHEATEKQARMNFMAEALSETASEEIFYEGNNALNIKV